MDEMESKLPEKEEKPKSQWQQTKEGWYDKIPFNLQQMNLIVWACYAALAIVFIKIFIDAGIFG